MDVPTAEILLADVVAHRVLHHRRPGDEQLRDVPHHHGEVAEHGLGGADADDAAEQHVHHRHGGELFRVHGAAEMPRQVGTAATGHARTPGLDGAAALLGAALAFLALRRHHRGDAAAAGGTVQHPDGRGAQGQREAIQVAALGADGAVGVTAAGGEVVGADDGAAAVDLAPAANVIGRREGGYRALLVVGGETSDAADLAEGAGIEEQIDALPAGVLAAAALTHHAGIFGPGGQALERQPAHGGDVVEQRRPRRLFGCRLARRARGRIQHRHHLARGHAVADVERLRLGHHAGARGRHLGLHLHRAHHQERLSRLNALAGAHPHIQHRAAHWTSDRFLTRAHRQGGRRGGNGRRACATCAQRCGLLPQQRQRAVRRRLGRGGEQLRMLLQKGGAGVPRKHRRVAEDRFELADVGGETGDVKLAERPGRARHRRGVGSGAAGRAHHFGEQRIELRRRRVAHVAAGVHAHAGAGWLLVGADAAGTACHHPRLHGKAARLADGLLAAEAQRIQAGAGGNAKLRFHQIDASNLFRHRVFHLNARIALDEEVLAGLWRHQKLHRAGVGVIHRPRQGDGVREDALAQRVVQAGRRGRLHHLLVAQLHGAVALVQVDDGTVRVAENLHLDVARAGDQLLDEQGAIAERRFRFTAAACEGVRHRARRLDHAHATPAATCCRLEHDGIADRVRARLRLRRVRQRFRAARHDGNIQRPRQLPRPHLVAEQRQRRRRRADESDALGRAALGERRILGEEAIARMHAVAIRLLGDLQQGVHVQVGPHRVLRRIAAEGAGVRGAARVQRQRIGRRVHAHRLHAQGGRRPGDANGDFAAIGDEYPLMRRHWPSPYPVAQVKRVAGALSRRGAQGARASRPHAGLKARVPSPARRTPPTSAWVCIIPFLLP